MNFLFRESYWAGILILAGVLLILRNVFKLDLPVMGIIIPVIIISWGVSILVNSNRSSDNGSSTVFSHNTTTEVNEGSQHSVVFGKGDYDLRKVKPGVRVDIDAVFSTANVRIDPNVPMRIKISSAFASARMPDGAVSSFGERRFFTKAYQEGQPFVDVRCDVVFGDLRIIEDSTATF